MRTAQNASSLVTRFILPLLLSVGMVLSTSPLALAGPGDVNSVNNGSSVQGGTYYNTAGDKTTFINSGGGGITVGKGTNVRGLEVDGAGGLTGNGGWLHFSAPKSVVRIDGNVDVSALKGANGFYAGNGGRVTVDAAYYYQNGNIWANGINGGSVQFNVGAAMFGPGARVEARGYGDQYGNGGNGGQISVNSPGVVDIRGAVFDSSGKVIGTYDTNIINIEGGLVYIEESVIRADGVELPNGEGSRGGTIRLVATGNASNTCVDCALDKVTQEDLSEMTLADAENAAETSAQLESNGKTFTAADSAAIKERIATLVEAHDGDVVIGGNVAQPTVETPAETPEVETFVTEPEWKMPSELSANGTTGVYGGEGLVEGSENGKGGGTIIITAANNIENNGLVTANGGRAGNNYATGNAGNGGDGGTIAGIAGNDITNTGLFQANGGNGESGSTDQFIGSADGGNGGNGGAIAFSYGGDFFNQGAGLDNFLAFGPVVQSNGLIQANGGNGGNGLNTRDTAISEEDYEVRGNTLNAVARATGGNGGKGGSGGLVVFSGNRNPEGLGTVEANGGNGGNGGNAFAEAKIENFVGFNAHSQAYAYGGDGGKGGDAGLIVAPRPNQFGDTQAFSTQEGMTGTTGEATANAFTTGAAWFDFDLLEQGTLAAYAFARTGDHGTANARAEAGTVPQLIGNGPLTYTDGNVSAIAQAEAGDWGTADARTSGTAGRSSGTDFSDNVYLNSVARSGDYGSSNATATGFAYRKNTNVTAYAISGDQGYSNAFARSNNFGNLADEMSSIATATAHSGDNGYSVAWADSLSAREDAQSNVLATSGANGVALATSLALAEQDDAEANATATTGDNGYSKAEATANGDDDSTVASNATSGENGYAQSSSTGAADGGELNLSAGAVTGNDGKSIARGQTNSSFATTDDIDSFNVSAATGDGGEASATASIVATGDLNANIEATGGNQSRVLATVLAELGNDVENVRVAATTGDEGYSNANADIRAADDVKNLTVLANTGNDAIAFADTFVRSIDSVGGGSNPGIGTHATGGNGSVAKAKTRIQSVSNDVSDVLTTSLAGDNGAANSFTTVLGATGTGDDVTDVVSRATAGHNGEALAVSSVNAGNDVESEARATSGDNGSSFASATSYSSLSGSSDYDASSTAVAISGNGGSSFATGSAASAEDVELDVIAQTGAGGSAQAYGSFGSHSNQKLDDVDVSITNTVGATTLTKTASDTSSKVRFFDNGFFSSEVNKTNNQSFSLSIIQGLLNPVSETILPVFGSILAEETPSRPFYNYEPTVGSNDVHRLQDTELILHNENAILLNVADGGFKFYEEEGGLFGGLPNFMESIVGQDRQVLYLSDLLANANVRTIEDLKGSHFNTERRNNANNWIERGEGGPEFGYNASRFNNLVVANTAQSTLVMDQSALFDFGCHGPSLVINDFNRLNTLTALNNGSLVNPSDNEGFIYGPESFIAFDTPFFGPRIPGYDPFRTVIGGWNVGNHRGGYDAIGGGHISWIAIGGSIVNNNVLRTHGGFSGGSVNLMANGNRLGGGYVPLLASGALGGFGGPAVAALDIEEEEGPGGPSLGNLNGLIFLLAQVAPDGVYNFDLLGTSGGGQRGLHGGSVLARGANIINFGDIRANGDVAGGNIKLVANEAALTRRQGRFFDELLGEFGFLSDLIDVDQWTGVPWTGHIINGGRVVANANGAFSSEEGPVLALLTEEGPSDERSCKGDCDEPETFDELGTVFGPHGNGGSIEMIAGNLNINLGTVRADGNNTGGDSHGGFVHQHGDGVAANFGLLQANGNKTGSGGRVILTGGDTNHDNDDFNLLGLPDVTVGDLFGFFGGGGSSPFNNVVITRRESAYNFGQISAVGGAGGGIAILAGNNQLANGGVVTANRILTYVGQDINGKTAVELAACSLIPEEEEQQAESGLTFSVLGLFQDNRFVTNTGSGVNQPVTLAFTLGNGEDFLKPGNLATTEEFLAMVAEAYEQLLAAGESEESAKAKLIALLKSANVSPQVAQGILDAVNGGQINSPALTQGLLQAIAGEAGTTTPAGEEIIQ